MVAAEQKLLLYFEKKVLLSSQHFLYESPSGAEPHHCGSGSDPSAMANNVKISKRVDAAPAPARKIIRFLTAPTLQHRLSHADESLEASLQ
jgi:hypothetical protein